MMPKRKVQAEHSTEHPPEHLTLTAPVQIDLQAAAAGPDGRPRVPQFEMVAYTGGPMRLSGWRHPVVVDLGSLTVPSQLRSILYRHDPDRLVGQTSAITNEGGRLTASGALSIPGADTSRIVDGARNGFKWQASIGASVTRYELVRDEQRINVNGREIAGPVYVVQATLDEISFVDRGADGNTSASVAAKENTVKQQKSKSNNPQDVTSPATIPAAVEGAAEASVDQVQEQPAAGDVVAAVTTTTPPPASITAAADPIALRRSQEAAETRRVAAIRKACNGRFADIEARAIEEGWEPTRAELEVLRAARPTAPAAHIPDHSMTPDILQAAACQAARLPHCEQIFEARTLEAAQRAFRGRLGLQRLLLEGAWANGYCGRSFDDDRDGALRAAFSTMQLPGILQSVANRFLLAGFNGVENVWQRIAAIRAVRDFKAVTSYRMSGAFEYDEVGPTGELKHGQVDEENFTNQAKTYGKMFSVTRTDLINDDLGALTTLPQRIGRGGALKLNKEFWAKFLANTAFFTLLRGNYKEGADTALTVEGLTAAELLFLEQKDTEGSPLGLAPRTLLVPPALLVRGSQLMQATELRDTTASTKYPTNNPHTGKFKVEYSSYLSNSTLAGASSKAWYLLSDPADLAVIEVAFLNGQQTPTVERADADFNLLGIMFRGYFDFGVALQDYRAGTKMKGEA